MQGFFWTTLYVESVDMNDTWCIDQIIPENELLERPSEVLVEDVVDDGVATRIEVGAPQEEAAQAGRVVDERSQLHETFDLIWYSGC